MEGEQEERQTKRKQRGEQKKERNVLENGSKTRYKPTAISIAYLERRSAVAVDGFSLLIFFSF